MKQQLDDHRNKGESQSQDFVTRVTELQNEMESYRVELSEKERTIQEFRGRERELEEEISDLKKELDTKQRGYNAHLREAENINKEKTDLEIEINALRGKVNVSKFLIFHYFIITFGYTCRISGGQGVRLEITLEVHCGLT